MAFWPTQVPLGILVELLINGTFQDITQYVRARDDIIISGGAPDETTTPQPAQMTLTLNNSDGRFSPDYTAGAYYPYLKRNIQIRVSVTATSVTSDYYSGYRFWGTVAVWPPMSDITGRDVYVQVTCNGPLRQVNSGGGQGSALARYYGTLTGSYAPVAYWQCEEDPDSGQVQSGVDGGQEMNITYGSPTWKAISHFNGSRPIGVLNGSTWDGLTGSFGSSGDDVFDAPGTYTWVASTTSVDCRVWGPGGGGESGNTAGGGKGGNAGGGGELAEESTLAVTPGTAYTVVIRPGGAGGYVTTGDNPGSSGATQSFSGDSVTVTAHGGQGGTSAGAGAGGTGSTNITHRNGGAGGAGAAVLLGPYRGGGGGGGGGSGGTAAAGNTGPGAPTSSLLGGAGATAVTGGGAGGHGGANPDDAGNTPGGAPGGGGGGGGVDTSSGTGHSGTAGAPGRVELIYTPATVASTNVIRFIMYVPPHGGGNNGMVVLRALTSSSVLTRVEVAYAGGPLNPGGVLALHAYNAVTGGTLTLNSGNQAWHIDGKTIMVSVELFNYTGGAVYWALSAIVAGASATLGYVYGTVATAAVGNVSEVIVAPNHDVTKTAVGHISVQYAYIPLIRVSDRLSGHDTEVGVDRFIRLCNEQAMAAIPQFSEKDDHWGFEDATTQSCSGTNCSVSNSVVTNSAATPYGGGGGTPVILAWPSEGSHSLLLTAAGGAGQWYASSPGGTSGRPVQPGDQVSVTIDVYVPAALGNVSVNLDFDNAAGTYLSTVSGPQVSLAAATVATVKVTGTAPATAQYFSWSVGNRATSAASTLLYIDHVRVHPQMGPQTAKELKDFLREIQALDQGILREAKATWGLGYRTRFSLINQAPAVTLDYTHSDLAAVPEPVVDDFLTKNKITVKRVRGSTVTVTDTSSAMSVQQPPNGIGRLFHGTGNYVAQADEQLAALAAHLLNLGTNITERYPSIVVDLARTEVASLMSAIASAEVGDLIQINSMPYWYPSTTVKQQVKGYTETINAFKWVIEWNCVPDAPWQLGITSVRRW